jgi:hypothetical protein
LICGAISVFTGLLISNTILGFVYFDDLTMYLLSVLVIYSLNNDALALRDEKRLISLLPTAIFVGAVTLWGAYISQYTIAFIYTAFIVRRIWLTPLKVTT